MDQCGPICDRCQFPVAWLCKENDEEDCPNYLERKEIEMAKKMAPKGKKVKGCDYVAADEVYDEKTAKKEMKGMKTAGIAKELKGAQKEEGYSKKPRVKPQKKTAKPAKGQKKIY